MKDWITEQVRKENNSPYFSGHELAFTLFLFCLRELGVYGKEDYETLVRNVFYR
jgi:hypothetical protein